MRPLIWTSRRAFWAVAAVFGWLASIELGTSRRASREARATASKDDSNAEVVVDTATSRAFDLAMASHLVGGVVASRLVPRATIRFRRSSFSTGIGLLIGAGVLSGAARQHLGRFHRDDLTVHADHELIETGPYATIRHPLYTATGAAMVGVGAVLGNRIAVLTSGLPIAALIRRIGVEEAMLVERLGDDYLDYCTRTRRLVPGLW